jgi:Large polyvalent protein-associated domain 7
MDTENSPARTSSGTSSQAAAKTSAPEQTQGGVVEPANRATIAKERFQTPTEALGERYELRDPFAEITYRSTHLIGMVAKADQLGITRFVGIDDSGQRTTVQKVGDEWHRGPQRPPAPERLVDPVPVRDDVPAASRPAARAKEAAPIAPIEANDRQSTTAIDAKAERAAMVAKLETALMERYVIKRAPVTMGDLTVGRTEYRFRGDTSRVAFTESTFRLATDTNSPSVARSMVDVAQARNWQALRVSGNEDFKRMVWLEASVRGVKALGYEPNPGDMQVLKQAQEARLVNRIEPARDATPDKPASTPTSEKASARGGGGRKAVLVAIEALLVAKRVPEKQREAVMAAAADKLAQRTREGQAPKVKVYDKSAPSKRPVVMPVPEVQRTRDRAAPVR